MNRDESLEDVSAEESENETTTASEFPTFSAWSLECLKGLVAFFLLAFVVYPLLAELAIWLGWQNVFRRVIGKARIRNNPKLVLYTVYLIMAVWGAYPILALGHHVWSRLSGKRAQGVKAEKRKPKNRIV